MPWGRSFDEYRRMFGLTDSELRLRIVGCGDGPASFNAEATRRGAQVISFDPIYCLEITQIRDRIAATYDTILDQTRRNADEFVWESIQSVEELGHVRMAAMQDFLDDYGSGRVEGRYVDAELPTLPFADAAFDLALCSHFLFLYSSQLGEAFHRSAIREMCRVAAEIRFFRCSRWGAPSHRSSTQRLANFGTQATTSRFEDVPYEFQRGGNRMMRLRKRADG